MRRRNTAQGIFPAPYHGKGCNNHPTERYPAPSCCSASAYAGKQRISSPASLQTPMRPQSRTARASPRRNPENQPPVLPLETAGACPLPRLPTAIQGDGVPLLILWGLFPASPVFPAVPQKLPEQAGSRASLPWALAGKAVSAAQAAPPRRPTTGNAISRRNACPADWSKAPAAR